jgi:GcrA cell cycle regulator
MLQGPIGLSRAPRRRPVSPWTTQRTRVLRRRWAQGARVREIAAELGHGITYNAVIGKIHRLGISELSPYGGAPGRRSTANTLPADRPVDAPRPPGGSGKGRCRLGSSTPNPMSRLLTPTRVSRAASAVRSSN